MSHLRLPGLASSASAPPRNAAATRAPSRFGFAPIPPFRCGSGVVVRLTLGVAPFDLAESNKNRVTAWDAFTMGWEL